MRSTLILDRMTKEEIVKLGQEVGMKAAASRCGVAINTFVRRYRKAGGKPFPTNEAVPRPDEATIRRMGAIYGYRESARRYGVSHSTFLQWFLKAGGKLKKDDPDSRIPSRQELEEKVRAIGVKAAAKEYKKSAETVRKWCSHRGILWFNKEHYLNLTQAARMIGVSPPAFRQWINAGMIRDVVVVEPGVSVKSAIPVTEVERIAALRNGKKFSILRQM